MKKQKICIIGDGLAGLITAITLSKLNFDIDLVTQNIDQNTNSNRTVAISQNNLDFLKKLNIFDVRKKNFWPCSKIKLYSEIKKNKFPEIFELNNNYKQKKILYLLENSILRKYMIKKIKKIKSISVKRNKYISRIVSSKFLKRIKFDTKTSQYNLIIICTGNNSNLIQDIFPKESLEYSYEETAITTILDHSSIENNVARQIFLEDEIIALLPLSRKKTSVVWTVKKKLLKKDNVLIKKRIKFFTKDFLTKIEFPTNIEYKDLSFLIRNKYYQERILLFGDALHVVHPFAGQGFNMILRDLSCLKKILLKKSNLGLDIGSSDTLSEFSDKTKPRNFIYSMGIDVLKNSFSLKNQFFKERRNYILKILNNNNFTKKIFYDLANGRF